MAENGGIGLTETHSVGAGVDPQSSPAETLSDSEHMCRICWASGTDSPLYYPCACRGSIKYVHESCLLQWINQSSGVQCQICEYSFAFSPVYAPWRLLSFRELMHAVTLLLKLLAYLWILWIFDIHFTMRSTRFIMYVDMSAPKEGLLLFERFLANFVLKQFCLRTESPSIRIVMLARPVTFAFARWIFPLFGYSIMINLAFSRYSGLCGEGLVGLAIGCRAVKALFDLHNGIKDRNVVGRRLENCRGSEKAHVD